MDMNMDMEDRWEMWWQESEALMTDMKVEEKLAKLIWMEGQTVGYKVGFDEGRKCGRKEASQENW